MCLMVHDQLSLSLRAAEKRGSPGEVGRRSPRRSRPLYPHFVFGWLGTTPLHGARRSQRANALAPRSPNPLPLALPSFAQGPFDFLVGFSQGGMLATLLTAFLEKPECLQQFLASGDPAAVGANAGGPGSQERLSPDLSRLPFGGHRWRYVVRASVGVFFFLKKTSACFPVHISVTIACFDCFSQVRRARWRHAAARRPHAARSLSAHPASVAAAAASGFFSVRSRRRRRARKPRVAAGAVGAGAGDAGRARVRRGGFHAAPLPSARGVVGAWAIPPAVGAEHA